jgi:Ohr subfamily peroxiredoxin
MDDALYRTSATAFGGRRDGKVVSADNRLVVSLAMPRELGGDGGEGTNPEQLFAAGYAGCFHSAMRVAARKARVELASCEITASVGIGRNDDGEYDLAVRLDIRVDGTDQTTARALADIAHRQLCPYSRAIRGNLELILFVNGEVLPTEESAA